MQIDLIYHALKYFRESQTSNYEEHHYPLSISFQAFTGHSISRSLSHFCKRMNSLIAKIERFVSARYQRDAPAYLHYHNLQHTQDVVFHAMEISLPYDIKPDDFFVLVAAAWFHDLGQVYGPMNTHEELSVTLMKEFLNPYISQTQQQQIAELIMATKYPPQPAGLLQEIICDADTYHLGTAEFFYKDQLVQQEMEARTGVSHPNWDRHSLSLLQHHHFFTSYCKNKLTPGVQANIEILTKRCLDAGH